MIADEPTVEGETLADAIAAGKLTVEEAIEQFRKPTLGERVRTAGASLGQGLTNSFLKGNAAAMELEANALELVGMDKAAGVWREMASSVGERAPAAVERAIPVSEHAANETGFWPRLLTQGAPQALGSAAGSLLVPGGKGLTGIATRGALVEAGQMFYEARAAGATEEEQWIAFVGGAALGTTEAGIPGLGATPLGRVGQILSRIDRATDGKVSGVLKEAIKGGFVEGTQEALQSIGENLLAKNLYDDDRRVFQDVLDSGAAGALTGLLGGAMVGHVQREPGAKPSEPTPRVRIPFESLSPEEADAAKSHAPGVPVQAIESPPELREFVERRGGRLVTVEAESGEELPNPASFHDNGTIVLDAAAPQEALDALVNHEVAHMMLENVPGAREAVLDRIGPELRALAQAHYESDALAQAEAQKGAPLEDEEKAAVLASQNADEGIARIAEDFTSVVQLLRQDSGAFSKVSDVGFWRGLMRSALDVVRSWRGKPVGQEARVAALYRSVARMPLAASVEPARGIEIATAVKELLDAGVGRTAEGKFYWERPAPGQPTVRVAGQRAYQGPRPAGEPEQYHYVRTAPGQPMERRAGPAPQGPAGEAQTGGAASAPASEAEPAGLRGLSEEEKRRGVLEAVGHEYETLAGAKVLTDIEARRPSPVPEPKRAATAPATTANLRGAALLARDEGDLRTMHAQALAAEDVATRARYPDSGPAWYERVANLRRQARDPSNPEGDRAALALRRAGIVPEDAGEYTPEEISDALREKVRVRQEAKRVYGERGQVAARAVRPNAEGIGRGPRYAQHRAAYDNWARGVDPAPLIAAAERLHPDQPTYAVWRRAYPLFPTSFEITFDAADRQLEYWQDAWRAPKKWVESARAAGKVNDANDVYLNEELRRGLTKARMNKEHAAYIDPLKAAITKAGKNVADVETWLMARHAAERNAAVAALTGRQDGSGMSDATANAILAAAGPEYAPIGTAFDALNGRVRELWEEYELETPETVAALNAKYQHFAPLRTDTEIEHVYGERPNPKRKSRGIQVRGREFKAALGRTTIADVPLSFAAADLDSAIMRGEKNRVFQTMHRLARATGDPKFATVDKPAMRETVVNGKVRKVPDFEAQEFEVDGKIKGEIHRVRFAPDWVAIPIAFKNTGSESSAQALRFIPTATRFIAALSTRWNPFFGPPNLTKDVLGASATVTAEHGARVASEMLNPARITWAMRELTVNGTWTQRYRASGAPISFLDLGKTPTESAAALQKDIDAMRAGDRRVWARIATKLEQVSDVFENSTRLAAFRYAIEKLGMSDKRAASFSKNLTTNFERHGQAAWLNGMYAFSNAGIQSAKRVADATLGRNKVGRIVVKPGAAKLIAGMIVGAAILDAINRGVGGDDDDGIPYYDKVPQWKKQTHAIVMLPGTQGDYISIPLPFNWGLFHVLGTALGQTMSGGVPISQSAAMMGSAAFDQLNPLGGGSDLVETLTPTLADPLVQIARGKNWQGRDLYPDTHGQPTPDSELAWDSTNPTLVAITRWLNKATGGNEAESGLIDVSPITLGHIAQSYTGGVGSEAGRVFSAVDKLVRGEEIGFGDIPLWRRYIGELDDRARRDVYRQHVQLVREVETRVKRLEARGQDDEAGEVQDTNAGLWRLRTRVRAWGERLGDLDEEARGATDPDEKRRILALKREIQIEAVTEIREAMNP